MIGDDKYSSLKFRKNNFKTNRTYSLYLQKEIKQQRTLQERELERIVSKDIQSNNLIREEVGEEAWKLLELMKLIFMLKNNSMQNFFAHNTNLLSKELRMLPPQSQLNFK